MSRVGLVYLAGSIDNVETYQEAETWRKQAENVLIGHGIASFNPYGAFCVVGPVSLPDSVPGQVVRINRQAVEECDVVLANLLYGSPFETLREIEHARRLKKRVVAITDSPSFGTFDLEVYKTLEAGLSALVGEEVQLDT